MRYMTMEGMNSLGGVCLTDGRMGEEGTGGRGRGGSEDEKEEQQRVLRPAPKKGHS